MALAPVAGTRLLVPFRITIVHMLVQATRFEAAHTVPTTGQREPSR
jgi:hypothetical protein